MSACNKAGKRKLRCTGEVGWYHEPSLVPIWGEAFSWLPGNCDVPVRKGGSSIGKADVLYHDTDLLSQ